SLFGGSEEEMDPLAALDKAQGKQEINAGFGNNEDPFSAPSFSDQADPLNQQISWPDAAPEAVTDPAGAGGIPDDWDDDFASPASDSIPQSIPLTTPPVTPKPAPATDEQNFQSAPSPAEFKSDSGQQKDAIKNSNIQNDLQDRANARMQTELDLLKQQLDAQRRGGHTEVTVDTSLIDSLGLQNHNLTDSEITKINHLAGDVIKEMVRGLMQVLGSRGSIKNEFRMQVTTIQPVENNPLKFSANVEDALENMFVKKGKAFKKPVEAVQEGFESVAEHQVAILAGIKSAFKSVIERFDPALLEERFSKQSSGGFMPGSQKAKNWDLYNQYYNDMVGDLDESFHYLFGDDFVRAYEEQLQKMMISKKAKKQH
ncbi:MAG: type VI secretion system-associated FHA domain protein TagH, partial [Gammaproteobacteria bacterium]|nr:type VI secretion system-associated FHA domain protein TagH [Gammaproteobacteria bacterium]